MEHWDPQGGYGRLYFGQEFCERLLPSVGQLDQMLDQARELGLAFTLVTPYVTEEGLERVEALVEHLSGRGSEYEVVVNDWGVLHWLRESYPKIVPVLGRLLTKQKRGPRILNLKGLVPDAMLDHFRRSNVDLQIMVEFLKKMGITRVELDNLLQGVARENPLAASIYTPYAYISTTRLCLTNSCDHRTQSLRAIFPCGQECRIYRFRLTHPSMPVPLILGGNTYFYRLDELPANLEQLGIDRVVFQPEIPI